MKVFYGLQNLRYETIDLQPGSAERVMDLTSLTYADGTFDWVICFHVLEHIPDDRRAMREILRVLKPGGIAILQSPVHEEQESTYEDFSIVDERGRESAFGQKDHVRVYGRDYVDRLHGEGFTVERVPFSDELGPEVVQRCSLRPHQILYICTKPV